MQRTATVDLSMFLRITEYLEEHGCIAEADYGMFTAAAEGLDEAMR